MLEQTRPQRQRQDLWTRSGNLFDGDDGGMVTISSGVHDEALPVVGMSVGEIRTRFADRFDIDPESTAELDSVPVSEDTVVQNGQLLMFVHKVGEKGRER